MKKTYAKFIYSFLAILAIWGSGIICSEVATASTLPSGMVVGDDQGIQVQSDGAYLVDVRDVEPGKKWETKITAINLERDIPYHLTMYVSKPTLIQGNLDLSEAIQMRMVYDGKEVYNGPLSGKSSLINLQNKQAPLDLGVFESGQTRTLEVYFELDGEKYTNKDFVVKNVVENIWYFKAVKATKTPGKTLPSTGGNSIVDQIKGLLPSTGEEWSYALLFICIGLFLIVSSLLILKHRNQSRNKGLSK